jgi:hypothetical protein
MARAKWVAPRAAPAGLSNPEIAAELFISRKAGLVTGAGHLGGQRVQDG